MKDSSLVKLTLPALVFGALASCAPGGVDESAPGEVSDARETIAVFTKNQTNPFFETVRAGTEDAARQMNADVIQYIPTRPDSIPEQISQLDDTIINRPDAIVFTPVDSQAMVAGIERVNAANIPVINITDPVLGGEVVSFMGCDEYSLAVSTVRYLVEKMNGRGNVIILEGVGGSLNSNNRVNGFLKALEDFPDVTLLASQPGNFQRLQALQVTEKPPPVLSAARRYPCRERFHGVRRDRSSGCGQPRSPRRRSQRYEGSDRRHKGGNAVGVRRL